MRKMLLQLCIILIFYLYSAKSDSIYFQDSMMKEVHFDEGSTFNELKCTSTGFLRTPSQVEWYDEDGNNLELLKDSRFSIHQNTFQSILSFNASLEKTGLYICNVRNSDRNENKIYEVFIRSEIANRIEDEDAVLVQNVELINVTDDSASFEINTTKIAKEFIAIYVEEIENIMISRKFISGNKILFTDLIPGGKYKFQFLARPRCKNPWTKIYSVNLLPSVPEVVMSGLEKKTFQIEWFHQREDPEGKRGSIDKYLLSYSKIELQNKRIFPFKRNRKVVYILNSSNCSVAIEIPACLGTNYTVTGLESGQLYQIALQAHNTVGYGKPFRSKLRIP